MLQLLVDTAEGYKQMNEGHLELFKVIALDAGNADQGCMTSNEALELLTEARTQDVSTSH